MRIMLALSLFALTACGAPATDAVPGQIAPTGATVATVNGHQITEDMLEIVTSNIPPAQLKEMQAGPQWEQMIEQVAIGEVLYLKAIEKKLHEQDDVQLAAAMASRNAIAREFLDSIASEAISDEKIQAKYDEQSVRYAKAQVSAKHILVREEALATDLKGQVDGGADFDALAKEHSVDPGTKDKGGDLGWFEQSRMVGPFAEAAFAADKGATVGPIQTRFGYHIIRVNDKRDSIPLSEVRDQLEDELKKSSVETYLDDLKKTWTYERAGATAGEPETETPAAPAAPPAPADDHGHEH